MAVVSLRTPLTQIHSLSRGVQSPHHVTDVVKRSTGGDTLLPDRPNQSNTILTSLGSIQTYCN